MNLLETAGLEIEFANVQKEVARDLRSTLPGWTVFEDRSCVSYRQLFHGFEYEGNDLHDQRDIIFGGELISPTFSTENSKWLDPVSRILDTLYRLGEGVDARTSIHIHINGQGWPLFALKNLLVMGLYLESAMYRLAIAEGGIHRGRLIRDYGYCRPLSSAPVTPWDGTYIPVFTPETLLAARTTEEFQKALGRYDRAGGRYHEARYTWLNFLSLYLHGSIEFRVFNFTASPGNIWAWVHLCRDFVRASFGKYSDLPRNPLGSTAPEFADVIEFLMIDDEVAYKLELLWNQAEFQAPVRGHQIGHLRDRTVNWSRTAARILPQAVSNVFEFDSFSNKDPMLVPGYRLL